MEDDFAADRPPWEDAGALFTDRIHDWEQYKLRMLNAGHSCMAYLSALAGITYVHEAMAVPAVRTFLEGLLQREAIPTLVEIPGHPREDYAASVLERFANVGVRDQIARVCIDGSAKFPTFLIPTIERQLERGGPIERAATALAGWARYLARRGSGPAGVRRQRRRRAALRRRGHRRPRGVPGVRGRLPPGACAHPPRFRSAFAAAYEQVAAEGPIAAMRAARRQADGD